MVLNVFNRLRLRTKLSLLIGVLFIVPLCFVGILINNFMAKEYYSVSGERAMAVATFVATYPKIVNALAEPGSVPFEEISRFLDTLTTVTQVRYIVPMNMRAERLYHPDHEKIGFRFVGGDEARALQGETYTSAARGTLGFSQRSFVPVFTPQGEQVGVIAVGIMADAIESIIAKVALPIKKLLLASLVLGLSLAILLAESIKKILFGLEPGEIATLLQERSSMLQMVNEGVIAINLKGHITLANDEARRILHKAGIEDSLLDKPFAEIAPVGRLFAVMKSGVPQHGDELTLGSVTILANYMPVTINNVTAGAITTFKDLSEVRKMAEEITDIKRYADALRSQSHEFMNKLHVIMGLLSSGKQEKLRTYVEHLVDTRTAEDRTIDDTVKDHVIAGFLSSKYCNARELGVSFMFESEGILPVLSGSTMQHGLITILGNLIDNALDAVGGSPVKELRVRFSITSEHVGIIVADTGEGMEADTLSRIFDKGFSTKGEGRGLGLWLVAKTVDEMEGDIDLASHPGSGTVFNLTLPLTGLTGEAPC